MHRELTRATRLGVCLCLCSMGVWAFNFPGTRIAAPTALASGYYGTVTGNIGISVTVSTQPGETFGASYAALSVVTITPQPSGVPVVLPSARNGWQTPNFKSYIQGSDLPAGTTSVGISVKLVSSLHPAGQVVPTSGTHTILIDNDSPVTGTVKRIGVERYDINSTMRTDDYYNADFYGNPTPAVPLAGSPFRYTQSAYDDQDNTVALYSGSFADLRDANPAELLATPSVRFYRLTDSAALPTVYVCSTSIPIFLRDAASFSGADIHDPGYPAGVIANPGVPADTDGGDTAFDALSGNHNKTQFRVETDQMKPYEYTKAGYFARFGRQWEWQKEQLSESTYPVSTSLTQGNGYYWIHWRTFDANVANLNRTNIYHFGPILVYQEGPELTCDIDRGTVSCDQAYPSLITTGAQYISLLADPTHPETCIHSRTPETVSDVEVVEMVRTTGVSTWLGGLPPADPRYRADVVRTNPGCINKVKATVTRFYFLADRCGNGDFFSESFTVTDTTPPELPKLPQGSDLGCNPTPPTCTKDLFALDNCDGQVAVICSPGAITGTCNKSQTFTYTAVDSCGNPSLPADVTYTWTDDTTAPVFENCRQTAPIDLGCNPTLPTEAEAIAAAGTVTDTCDKTLVMTAVGEPITGTCTKQQVWTVTAATDCGPDATCMVTYTWTVETATLSIGTGYTILYPNGNPPNPGIVSPYELAGPGNWVTVPISIANPCTDLAQLVFEINFEAYDTASISPCCDETTDLGLRYMLGTERWDPDRVEPATIWNNMGWQHGTTVDGTDGTETLVQVEYGVAQDQVNYGRVIVYMDSPTGGAVIKSGTKGVFMWVMFRVSDLVASFRTFALTPNVIYATNLQGLEIPTTAEAGAIYADGCNWKLDVDRNGRVDPDTDGVTLYRALKYGHLDDDPSPGIFGCPVVPIVPPDFAELAGEYLPCDKDIVAGVLANLVPSLNVDGKFDGIATAIGGTAVSASRDGTYAYRNLAYFPTQIYPYYLPPGAYSPFVPPVVPGGAGLTVPAAHTNNAGIEPAINGNIDALKVLHCPSFQTQALPCGGSWFVTLPSGLKVLPLPQAAWSCGPP